MARQAERQHPPIAVPGLLRPLLRFSRLPERALDAVRQVVEEDVDLRVRVAAATDEQAIGRVSWLWLVRPEGWRDEVESAAAAAEIRRQESVDHRAEQSARRRVGLVEASLQRSGAELAATRASLAGLEEEMAELRRERRAEAQEAARDRAALVGSIGSRADAERRAEHAELCVTQLRQRLEAMENRLVASETANGELAARSEAAGLALAAAECLGEVERRRAATSESALRRAVAQAASAARGVDDALARADRILDGGPEKDPVGPPSVADQPPPAPVPNRGDEAVGKGGRAATTVGRTRRRPAPLPPAVLDDSPDAAAWLVRLAGVVVLVDGYNVTLAAWSGRDLPDQRHRLVSALAELSMRAGAQVEVIFDGDDDHAHPLRSMPARRPVRVTFSPPAVDADEVIIKRVGELPPDRPVIVATDDRRVRDQCRRAGANLLSVEQLVDLLGRSAGPGRL